MNDINKISNELTQKLLTKKIHINMSPLMIIDDVDCAICNIERIAPEDDYGFCNIQIPIDDSLGRENFISNIVGFTSYDIDNIVEFVKKHTDELLDEAAQKGILSDDDMPFPR